MRSRFFWAPTAAARWPDDVAGNNMPAFNWIKIDNRGAADVEVGLSNPSTSHVDYIAKVKAGKARILNIAGPDRSDTDDQWSQELHLNAEGATSVMIEISDHPIVDMLWTI
jgi:hypothetical protein